MKRVCVVLFVLSELISTAQSDSLGYYFKQLKKQDIGDSAQAYFNIRIGDYYMEINPADATPFSRVAYRLSEKISSTGLLYSSSKNLAAGFSGLGNYDSCLYYAKQSLGYARILSSPEFIFTALNLLGNAYIKKEQLANAKTSFDEALQLMNDNVEISHKNRVYLNLGNYYLASLNFKKSVEILKQGELTAIKEKEQDDLMRIYSSIGQSYAFTGKADSGLHYQLIALDYFGKNNKKREKAIALLRMGIAYGLASNTAKMEEYHDQAYEQYSLMGDNVSAINVLMGKVNFYFRAFQFAKCLKVLNKVEPRAAQYNLKEPIALSFIYRAGIFAIMKDTTRAAKYQQLAEELSKELKFTSFERMNGMIKAVVLSTRWKSEKGDSLVTKALLSVKNEIPDNMLESSLQSIALSKDFLKENKEDFISTYKVFAPDDSLEAGKYFDSLISRPIDSNLNIITGRQLLDLEAKYQNRLKADIIRVQKQLLYLKDKERKRLWMGISILSIFALFIIGLLIVVSIQKKRIAREKRAVVNLTGILKHETSRQFGELKTSIKNILKVEQPKQQAVKALTRVKTYEMLYNNLFLSDGLATISLKNAFEKIFEYHCDENVSVKKPSFSITGGENVVFNKSDYLFQYMNELIANSFEHAFNGIENPEINVFIVCDKLVHEITYRDNGIGFSDAKQKIIQGKGMYYIQAYATQNLNGTLEINGKNGAEYKLTFNEKNI